MWNAWRFSKNNSLDRNYCDDAYEIKSISDLVFLTWFCLTVLRICYKWNSSLHKIISISLQHASFICILFIFRQIIDQTWALRAHKLCQGQNLIRDSNRDFWINPDPDVCRIAPKMYWIHSPVGMNYFAKYLKNRPVAVWERLINLLQSRILQWCEKLKNDPEFVSRTESPAKVNHV